MACLLVLWILFASLVSIVSCEDCETVKCVAEISGNFFWSPQCLPSDELIVSRQHRCLDKYKHYVTRTCSDSGWVPQLSDVRCLYFIDENDVRTTCPPDYKTLPGVIDNIKVCVRILFDQSWENVRENVCLSSGSSLTIDKIDEETHYAIGSLLSAYGSSMNFWFPARNIWEEKLKDVKVFTGEMEYTFQWMLADKFGQNVNLHIIPLHYDFSPCVISFFQTAVFNVDLYSIQCDDAYFRSHMCSILCLYDQEQPTLLPLSCPDGYKTTRYAHYQNVCIKIHKFVEPIRRDLLSDEYVKQNICEKIFHIDSGFALHIFQELSLGEELTDSDRCLFGIIPDRVIVTQEDWTKLNMADVEFINWSFEATIKPETAQHILVAKANGEWIWEDGVVTCAICFIPNDIHEPRIGLSRDTDGNLVVAVEHWNYLWKNDDLSNGISCFSFTIESKRVESLELTPMEGNLMRKSYTLQMNGLGKYWCVGIEMRSFRTIEAEFLWHFPMRYAITASNSTTNLESPIEEQFYDFLKDSLDANLFQVVEVSLQVTFSQSLYLFHVAIIPTTEDFSGFEENLIQLNVRMLFAYYIRQELSRIGLPDNNSTPEPSFYFLSLNSTEFCLPASISQLDEINFSGAHIGRFVTSNELCLLPESGLPATKHCVGDGLYGGIWMDQPEHISCDNSLTSPSTKKLHNLSQLQMSSEDMEPVVYQLEEIISHSNHSSLIPTDIFYVSQIFLGIQHAENSFISDDVKRILRIYNQLLMVNGSVMYASSKLNSTNVLLDSVDVIVSDFAAYTNFNASSNGILKFAFDEAMLSTFIFNPEETNLTGIAVIERSSGVSIEFLNKNDGVKDIINIPNLKLASYVPTQLFTHLNSPLIVVSLFNSDVLFQSYHSSNPIQLINSSGSIISMVLVGVNGNLPLKLPIFFKRSSEGNVCGFWSFSSAEDGWATNGCLFNKEFIKSDIVLCECMHLTHYAYLFYGGTPIDLTHFERLQLITTVACSISLVGLCGIYLSAVLFKSWRIKPSTKFLLQISFALTIQLTIILFINTEANVMVFVASGKSVTCIALGVMLHYVVLVSFMWMLIIGVLQYMRYVAVFHDLHSERILLISSLAAWGLPMVPVVMVVVADAQCYIPSTDSYNICYPTGYSLYFGLMAPIVIITAANLVIFVLIIKSLTNNVAVGKETRAILLSKIRLWIFLFFLLGLPWIFAFLSAASAGLLFTYLFCATATLQGFILFFYFVILDPYVRGLWIGMCRKKING
ncbi:Adhesion G-protein coupled receptor G4 [Pseudolycoriella hygida]|uniref:Adhesion G-protein coupled receptor G4 n=1 Tax=Pseudolycoriella hygida TaxID=35572 RepID=A0A9Q0S3T1_9DIPT|nr:Adhesion G-protein coupled receptor G4 [Pseudolycoriella hygida]